MPFLNPQKSSCSAVYRAFDRHRHNTLPSHTVVLQSFWDFSPPYCRRHVGAPTGQGQSPHLYFDLTCLWILLVRATGIASMAPSHLNWIAIANSTNTFKRTLDTYWQDQDLRKSTIFMHSYREPEVVLTYLDMNK